MVYNPVMGLQVSSECTSTNSSLSAPPSLIASKLVSENYSENRSDFRCCQPCDVCHAEWSR